MNLFILFVLLSIALKSYVARSPPRYVGDRWNGCNVKENGTIILENACKRDKILILCFKSNKATGQNSKVSRRFRSKIGLYWEGLFAKCARVMGHKEWHGLIIDKMSDGKVAFESSLRFGGFFASDLINKTAAFHIFSKADALLENDFEMGLRLGAFMDDFDGMALRILALDLVSLTKYIGCQMKCSLPSPDGTEPTTLAFNTPDTRHAATKEPRTPILPSSTASDFDESSSCNGTSCVQFNLVNGCPYEIFVAGAVHVNLTAGTTKTKSVPAVRSAQRLWANTDCDKMNNPLCNLAAAEPPISLFEWTFDADGKQTFDVSYVDGANVPISVHVPNCSDGTVIYDNKLGNSLDQLVDAMPDAMKMVDLNGKKRVKSVCLAYGTDSVCCRNAHDQPTTCGPTHNWTVDQITGYKAMLDAFPTSYSYAYDDTNATRVCWHGTNYRIGFCTN